MNHVACVHNIAQSRNNTVVCPFQADVHGETEPTCDCCADCQHECVMEI